MSTPKQSKIKGNRAASVVGDDVPKAAPIPLDQSVLSDIADEALERTRQCAECNTTFQGQRADARFCTKECKNAFTNREHSRGALLFKGAYHWRTLAQSNDKQDQVDAKAYLKWMEDVLDVFITEDREAMRRPPQRAGVGD